MKTNTKKTIMRLLNSVDRSGMKNLINYLECSDFFEAPASTKFHGAYKGGLAEHSLEVYKLFKKKDKLYKLVLHRDTIVICSLLHDLCKINIYQHRTLKNGEPSAIPYSFNENLPLGHSTKSIFIINRFIDLTDEEAIIIRWHMSWSDYEFKKYIDNAKLIAPAIMAFICADIEASAYLA